ncbi:hydrolase [Mycolicibacterium canariasense]|uniref:Hydrolase n=1 Tax=Mycolicibacterium canariasense TaxID=228230 RepID=A0A117IBF3_MYCCR|nr:alpha/beta hydrolase [Mycolicibacterium canariasense]MCV7209877.1 alpha/beta hydrolase [Mycolicibacterium canariasense]ORV13856.1 hydrolase [Mycolicibacterium canariasense]GAS97890.1 hydrolase [Mycolicibacterium canariasense]
MSQLPSYDRTPGAGPTLVFLHYWGGSARTWDAVAECLVGRDLLAIDFRGWARSRALPGPYSLAQCAEDVAAILAAEVVTDFVVVGHSMGGKVAQLIGATRPPGLRGLVLVAPAPAAPPPGITPDYQQTLSHAYDTVDSVDHARDQILTATVLSAVAKARVLADSGSGADEARAEWPLRGIAEDIVADTQRVQVPVLVVAGEKDIVEPVEVLRNHLLPYLARASVVIVPATGHLIPLERPAELANLIIEFVTTLSPSEHPRS